MKTLISALTLLAVLSTPAYADLKDEITATLDDHAGRVALAKKEYDEQVARSIRVAITQLERQAASAIRKGDFPDAAFAWKSVLRLDSTHEDARRFFSSTGNLEDVLTELSKHTLAVAPSKETPKSDGLEFDGRSHVKLGSLQYKGSTPITFEAIVTAKRVSEETQTIIGNTNHAGVGLVIEKGFWVFSVRDANSYKSAKSDAAPTLNKRVHVAGVFDGRIVRIYVDGKLQRRFVRMESLHKPSSFPLIIGADPDEQGDPQHFFTGVIHAVRVSSTARYIHHFDAPETLDADKQTVGLWLMNENKGAELEDHSGNKHTGAIVGAKWIEKR